MDTSTQEGDKWYILGKSVPKQEIVFFSQIIILYILIFTCIINLSLNSSSQIWTSILSTCIGILVPNPSIKVGKKHLIPSDFVDGRMLNQTGSPRT